MILHVDMDAFYASVELRDRPELKSKPVVVGGSPKGRGVVAAASYEARKFGIYSAMSAAQAIRLCPRTVFIKPRMSYYAEISKQIREIFFSFTSLVEPLSLDEAFLDVSGSQKLFGKSHEIGRKIQDAIAERLNLPASVGVAPNKYLAKIASDLQKPNGFVVVDPDRVLEFLEPLPISRVWGIGPKTEKKFSAAGIKTIGSLRRLSKKDLASLFGVNAEHFWKLARGLDSRSVVPDRIAKSVSHETTFHADICDEQCLEGWLLELIDQVARRLRRHDIYGKTIHVKLRYYDFVTVTRSRTIQNATHTTQAFWEVAKQMLRQINVDSDRKFSSGVRLLGFGVSNLSDCGKKQQSLFDREENQKNQAVDETSDSIRDRFGGDSIRRGSSLEHNVKYRSDPRLED
ncbi:MAG: DNA polymerase IV [Planctomycetota bacterium]